MARSFSHEEASPSKPSILIVDDSALNRRILSCIMTKLGFAVYEATQGLEACDIYLKEASIVAVFLDLNMPLFHGWQTAQRLREMEGPDARSSKRLPVIVCTANDLHDRHSSGVSVSASALSAGADEVLHKPHCMRSSAVELVLDRLLPFWRQAVTHSTLRRT